MHKRENLSKSLGREQSKIGWKNPFKKSHYDGQSELNQLHMNMGHGHHFARELGSRNWQSQRGRG